MDDILKLQAELAAVQAQESAHRLSERNCVELILKLRELKLVHIVYTQSGREYVTPKQVVKEIRKTLSSHGGRLNVVDLQPLLGIDISFIESKVDEIVKEDDSIRLVEGELISDEYLDSVAYEINDALAEAGQLSFGQLTKRLGFSDSFLREIIESRLGSIIKGTLERTELFTDAFILRMKSRIRGVLFALTRPTNVSTIAKRFGFKESILIAAVQEFSAQKVIEVSLQGRGGGATLVPPIYAKMQENQASSFVQQNGYIDLDALHRLGVNNHKKFMKDMFPNAIPLSTVYITETTLETVEGLAVEEISSRGFADIPPLLPSVCDASDVAPAISASNAEMLKNCVGPLEDRYLVANTLLNDLEKETEAALRELHSAGKLPTVSPSAEQPAEDESRKKGKKSKKRESAKKPSSNEGLRKVIFDAFTKVCSKKVPNDAVSSLFGYVRHSLEKSATSIAEETLVLRDRGARKEREQREKDLVDLVHVFTMYLRAVECASEDTQEVLGRHLIRTHGVPIATNLIHVSSDVPEDELGDLSSQKGRKSAIEGCRPDTRSLLEELERVCTSSDALQFNKVLEEALETCGVFVRAADKKAERSQAFAAMKTESAALENETDPAVALHRLANVLFFKAKKALPCSPARAVPHLLRDAAEVVTDEQREVLDKFAEDVVAFLTAEDDSEEKASLRASLEERLGKIREIGAPPKR